MTGKEFIKYIKENNLENKNIYRIECYQKSLDDNGELLFCMKQVITIKYIENGDFKEFRREYEIGKEFKL
jgi:hypothetical protein